ncbi:haloacid dehalogenase-like hydrolase [Rosettibacter firmus]|uniref:haloacid dehalogenase-like hydrolase n=1 Tax=Rosettibacter firmus TaxID=3111522 RepID=UPI00336C1145
MKKINVIDLDNTLIKFDSFKIFTIKFLKKGDFLLGFLILLRKIRILTLEEFKRKVILRCRKKRNYNKFIREFADYIMENINQEIFLKINLISDENTINILASASPSDYVNLVAEKLGWESISTLVTVEKFFHNYGEKKVLNLLREYPREKFFYNYAISDSISDLELLKLFNNYELVS